MRQRVTIAGALFLPNAIRARRKLCRRQKKTGCACLLVSGRFTGKNPDQMVFFAWAFAHFAAKACKSPNRLSMSAPSVVTA